MQFGAMEEPSRGCSLWWPTRSFHITGKLVVAKQLCVVPGSDSGCLNVYDSTVLVSYLSFSTERTK